MKVLLWGLLWRLLVSALIAVLVLLAMLLLSACAKPAPLSPPIPTPTAVVPDKGTLGPPWGPIVGGENVQRFVDTSVSGDTFGGQFGTAGLRGAESAIRSQPALAWPKPRAARLTGHQRQEIGLVESSELTWRGLVVYDLNEPAFPVGAMATKAARTFLGCEVLAWIKVMGNMPKDAVGAAGERGGPQIHPSWRQKMAGMGLDIEDERHRWTFALWLAENSGWQNWSFCQHTAEGADGQSGEW